MVEPTPKSLEAPTPTSAPIQLKIGTLLILLSMLILPVLLLINGLNPFKLSPVEAIHWGATFTPLVLSGEYSRMLSSVFMHFSAAHLAFNLLGLALLGSQLEKKIHSFTLISFFLLSGFCGSLLHVFWDWQTEAYPAVSAGASGGVLGLLGALLILSLTKTNTTELLNTKALVWLSIINIGYGFIYPGIDNAAHIGGFLCGLVLGLLTLIIQRR